MNLLDNYDQKEQALIVELHSEYPEWPIEKLLAYVQQQTRTEYLEIIQRITLLAYQ